MSERKIKIKIDPMGNPVIEAEGFHGVGCKDATSAIEQALAGGDGNAVSTEFKPEYNEPEGVDAEVHEVQW